MEKNRKSVVVVGGLGRLGIDFIRACKQENYKVIIIDIINKDGWNKLDLDCDLFIQADINDDKSLKDALNKIINKFNKIDSVVNTSYPRGKNFGNDVFSISLEDFNENINLHLGGYFQVMQQFAMYFIEQGYGNIINIASIQGIAAPKFKHYEGTNIISPIEYTAAKSAIIAISRYMAKYLAGKNIRVNCISPGGIIDNQPDSFQENYKDSCTSKGMLDTKDIVGTLLFLLSDKSKYINGQNIIVDDGWSL